ncbi:hypothetical protein [uncultured Methanoregula sp.]|uniref:hypothetical protein n=1 Tax=uncultured Methanoregula sp. TaxID=1005933 RepID=UPI002AAB0B7C|nr:hypothetical protein [uncultured Methanoregula sp.]
MNVLQVWALVLGLALITPVTANASSDIQYFITIDPIGNHSVSDIFFVNGTTNLPVGDILLVQGYNGQFTPGRRGGSYIVAYIPVEPGYGGVNIYSFNLSPVLWETIRTVQPIRTHDFRYFIESDSYIVQIWANRSPNNINVFSNYFTILSGEPGALPAVSQTSIAPGTTTILPSLSPVTVNTTPIPPTPSVPLSGILPVLAITTMAVVWFVNKRRQG